MLVLLDTAEDVAYNRIVSLELFVLTVPTLSGILLILWLGPKRWPVAARNAWGNVSA